VAILREQGVNSQTETAAVFDACGFAAHDVHMTDLLGGRRELEEFQGLVACGGFSYGDVLGAGEGWAKSILFHEAVREQFERFFAREGSFALGICNGCQMFAALKSIIPGTAHWPRFVRNRSEQYEARFSLVEVLPRSPPPTPRIRAARRSASRRSRTSMGASPSSCRTPSARSATCRTPGGRPAPASTAGGCGCSATRGASSADRADFAAGDQLTDLIGAM